MADRRLFCGQSLAHYCRPRGLQPFRKLVVVRSVPTRLSIAYLLSCNRPILGGTFCQRQHPDSPPFRGWIDPLRAQSEPEKSLIVLSVLLPRPLGDGVHWDPHCHVCRHIAFLPWLLIHWSDANFLSMSTLSYYTATVKDHVRTHCDKRGCSDNHFDTLVVREFCLDAASVF